MFTPRRTLISLVAALALGVTACGGDSEQEKLQKQAVELQQKGTELQKKALENVEDIENGTKSAEDVAAELERDAAELSAEAADTASDVIDEVKDDAAVPGEVEEHLDKVQQDIEAATP